MPEIDVVHPLINITGIGIGDEHREMLGAAKEASGAEGRYSMKPLGGGNLLRSYDECMDFVLVRHSCIPSPSACRVRMKRR